MTRAPASLRAASITLFTGFTIGCSLITSYDGFSDGADAGADASDPRDATVDGALDSGTGCIVEIPDDPVSASSNPSLTPLVGVTTELHFSDVDGGCSAGLNIDRVVTCPGAKDCVPPGSAASSTCDEPGGADNSSEQLLGSLGVQSSLTAGLDTHSVGVVVSVEHYGGEPNLQGVTVSLYNQVGQMDGGTLVDPSAYVSKEVMIPLVVTNAAYVTDGVLTASFDSFPMNLLADVPAVGKRPLRVVINHVALVGRIQLDGRGIRIDDGQIAGRIDQSQISATLGQAIPCGTTIPSTELNYCTYLDVPSDPAKDGKGAACDAISIGFSFEASPSAIVGLGTPPALQVCDAGSDASLPPCQ